MGYILSILFAIVLCIALAVIGKFLRRSREDALSNTGRALHIAAPLIFLAWTGIHTIAAASHEIPAGHIGIVYEFGAIRGQVKEGFNLIWPWRSIRVENIQIQRHKFAGEDQLVSFSQETQPVSVQASLNIRVAPEAIQELYRSVGPNYFDVLVKPRVSQNFKDELVKYKSVDIAPNREKIRRAVSEQLERELQRYSIQVVDLLLDNIDFSDEFEKAIEQKQIATQRALEEEQKVTVERHRAEQAVEEAKGKGNSILAIAEKQSEANKKLGESLTPQLIQYAMVQKIGDKIQVALVPTGQPFILDGSFLKGEGR